MDRLISSFQTAVLSVFISRYRLFFFSIEPARARKEGPGGLREFLFYSFMTSSELRPEGNEAFGNDFNLT
jgi:hypothetical protein